MNLHCKLLVHFIALFFVFFTQQINAQSYKVQLLNGVEFSPGLLEKLEASDGKQKFGVIITFNNEELARQQRAAMKKSGTEFIGPKFDIIPVQGVNATREEIMSIIKLPGVIGVWENRKLGGELHQAVIVSGVKDVREDQTLISLNGGLPITGRGVGVLVNDSGFDGDSTDIEAGEAPGSLPRRIVQNVKGNGAEWTENFAADNPNRDSDQGTGHGSHCMGIVGGDGRKSNGKYTGVAPGAYLIGYGSGAALLILDTEGGFEYVAKHARDYNIRVMSNSFGSLTDTTFNNLNVSDPINVATRALADRGVIVVFSAGNSGPKQKTITGNWKTAPWVITVGNGEKSGTLAGSSSRGFYQSSPSDNEAQQNTITVGGKSYLWENRPTLTAPGTDIVSVRSTAGSTNGLNSDLELSPSEIPYYTILSGTSMACPHIAGVVALMLEVNPNLDWRAVKAILQRTAVPMTSKKWEAGTGYVNAWAAVAAAAYGLCNSTGTGYNDKYGLNADSSFGFTTDPWKSCPLKPEVQSRMRTAVPSAAGIENECAASPVVIADPVSPNDPNGGSTPPNPPPQFDIKEVTFHSETVDSFKITLAVKDSLELSPPGVANVEQYYYDVHFTLNKTTSETGAATPDIVYIVSAFDRAPSTKNFKLTVRSADGTTRPSTNASNYLNIPGVWDVATDRITWTVPKNLLNVQSTPATGADVAPRTSRPAKAGDRLKRWEAYIYKRPGTTTPDGAGIYDDFANGNCFKTLVVQ
jgi:serine protease AprX